MGVAYFHLGQLDKAEALYQLASETYQETQGRYSEALSACKQKQIQLMEAKGQTESAGALKKERDEITTRLAPCQGKSLETTAFIKAMQKKSGLTGHPLLKHSLIRFWSVSIF